MPDLDEFWMRQALAEAYRGQGRVEPNPMVGAAVVADGRLVGLGYHGVFGGPHAEVVALRAAGSDARGATLYVTLEPCCHHGKTPPCADAVIEAGVARVVVAQRDPFPRVAGGGLRQLAEAGLAVEVGLLRDAALALNAPYLKRLATGRPFVTAKWAMTLDGKIAARTGQSAWISGPRSRAVVHELRGRMDAIVVGIGTAIADDPRLTARPPGPRVPARVVLDGQARLPLDGRLATTARESLVLVFTTSRAPAGRVEALRATGCEVVVQDHAGPISVTEALSELGRRGATNVLVEGGSRVLGAFFDAGEVNAVEVFVAPLIEGGSHDFTPVRGRGVLSMAEALRLESHEFQAVDGDLRLIGRLPRTWPLVDSA